MITPDDQVLLFRRRCDTDLGFISRHLFGFNYDEDHESKERVTGGGIRADGPHGAVTRMLDSWREHPFMLELMCRDSYKSTMAKCFLAQSIIGDPNDNYLYAMKVEALARAKTRDVRRLVMLEDVQKLYGTTKGKPWREGMWSLGNRDPKLPIDNVNLVAVGVEQGYTGPHVKGAVIDDPEDRLSVKTDVSREAAVGFLEEMMSVVEPGGWILVIGTLKHELDVYHRIMKDLGLRELFKVFRVPCGMKMYRREDGAWDLKGKPNFMHLGETFLRERFQGMRPDKFASEYCLEIMPATDICFEREHFQVMNRWEPWLEDNWGYLVTDVATSTKKEACDSVVSLVSLDYKDHAYLHDVAMGHWPQPSEFAVNALRIYQKFCSKLVIKGLCIEETALTNIYLNALLPLFEKHRINIEIIRLARGRGDEAKDDRILGLQPRFEGKRFWVINEHLTKKVWDLREIRILWDSEGWEDDEGRKWPDGEIVRQAIHFPKGKKDWMDAMAMIDERDKAGGRYVMTPPILDHSGRRYRTLNAGELLAPMMVNGILRQVDVAARSGGDDWFAQKMRRLQEAKGGQRRRRWPSQNIGR